jgi:hypothetical protein
MAATQQNITTRLNRLTTGFIPGTSFASSLRIRELSSSVGDDILLGRSRETKITQNNFNPSTGLSQTKITPKTTTEDGPSTNRTTKSHQ